MTFANVPNGTQNASELRRVSRMSNDLRDIPQTLHDLMLKLEKDPPKGIAMIRTTAGLIAAFMVRSPDQITIQEIAERREFFRPFLQERPYAENSIRTYINHLRILLNFADEVGWAGAELESPWRELAAGVDRRSTVALIRHLAKSVRDPGAISYQDFETWARERVQAGLSSSETRRAKGRLNYALAQAGYSALNRFSKFRFAIPMKDMPEGLKHHLASLLEWKQAAFAAGRSHESRHRPITANLLRQIVSRVYGYAIDVRKASEIGTMQDLMTKENVTGYVEWAINERRNSGLSMQTHMGLLHAALRQFPAFSSMDLSWFPPLIDSLPVESDSERKKRRSEKYVDYALLERLPKMIAADRAKQKLNAKDDAEMAKRELAIRWLISLPWRQRNLRECRVAGKSPNVYRGRILAFSEITRPRWVLEQEKRNPSAEFWQFQFSAEETKTGIAVHALLPRQLVGCLEEYLTKYRHLLLNGNDPGTLFVNGDGNPLSRLNASELVGDLTLQYLGKRVTPHRFRDIVAFAWLLDHPQDFLTLSKLLWHSNINTTINTYGSRFNESSGITAMEVWLDEREARAKSI
jgi:integrase